MKNKPLIQIIFTAALVLLIPACRSAAPDASAACSDREAVFCEDFEGLEGDLGGSIFLQSSLLGKWWVTGDDEGAYLFKDFPVDGRSRRNIILLGDGGYTDLENSLLYTAELDLENVENATLVFNIIYRTEEHWDGVVVFAIQGGRSGLGDGRNWMVLTPENGYPDTVLINGTLFPGYSGRTSIWLNEKIDLAPVLGKKTILGFYFSSDDQIGEWGAALDDISISADGDPDATLTSPAINISELDLKLSPGMIVTPAIPRANLIADSPCEGSPEGLADGQRAYLKGLAESGEKALVLHPDNGRFCWIGLESIWIDGNPGELPRISDLKPEDYFLPLCPASFSPELTSSDCNVLEVEEDWYPYLLQSALVEEGFITRLDLVPAVKSEVDASAGTPDPRVGPAEVEPGTDFYSPPGGLLWAEVEGSKGSCFLDQKQSGRVICGGFSISAAGPVQLNLCWQGYGKAQACPPGFGNQPGGSCILLTDLPGCSPDCPAGYHYSADAGLCLFSPDLTESATGPGLCPAGLSAFSEAGCCGGAELGPEEICPAGYYYLPDLAACHRLSLAGDCPEGFSLNPLTGSCIPSNLTTTPRCTAIEAHFPVYEVTVRESTRCYKNPDNNNQIVSSLNPFTVVEVIGLGEDGETLVINNPDYGIPCWASLRDFYTNKLNLAILPVVSSQ
jgi:hypothetical protein